MYRFRLNAARTIIRIGKGRGRINSRRGGLSAIPKNRRFWQIASAIIANSYLPGFYLGSIYQGRGKSLCVPFLNCYSCPGAVAACPVGAIQSMAVGHRLSLYVLGTVLASGSVAGRAICGWLCPFGLFQDLISKIIKPRLGVPRHLRAAKYALMALIVPLAALPLGGSVIGAPYFCKYLCPAGTLQAALPLVTMNATLRGLVGSLFAWKLLVLVVLVLASCLIHRPFCRMLCPLGAFYGLLNRVSLLRLCLDAEKCNDCGACSRACPLDLHVTKQLNDPECIRCLRCVHTCREGAIRFCLEPVKPQGGSDYRYEGGINE